MSDSPETPIPTVPDNDAALPIATVTTEVITSEVTTAAASTAAGFAKAPENADRGSEYDAIPFTPFTQLMIDKVELQDLGATLPIGLFVDGECLTEFTLHPYKTKHDRILGQLLQAPKVKLHQVLGQFLPIVIKTIGGYTLEELKNKLSTSEQKLFENMYLGDILAIVLQIRLASQGADIAMSAQCPNCGTQNQDNPEKGKPYHDLSSVEVSIFRHLKQKPLVEVTLKDGFECFGDHVDKVLMQPLRLYQIDKIAQPASGTPVDIALLYSMICGLPQSAALRYSRGQIFSDELYDELSMADVSILRKAIDGIQPGPNMNADMSCYSCGHEWASALPWSSLRQFLYVAPTVPTRSLS